MAVEFTKCTYTYTHTCIHTMIDGGSYNIGAHRMVKCDVTNFQIIFIKTQNA